MKRSLLPRAGWTALSVASLALLPSGCGAPSLGSSPEAYRLVMRLHTAVMGKQPDLLPKIEEDARALQEAGQLPEPALQEIEQIIRSGQAGAWDEAQDALLDFQKGQPRPSSSTSED